MLKAVRFDEEKHKHLIEFITSYKDNKDKVNESEGIRYLMELGYGALNSEPMPDAPQDTSPQPFNILNVDELKEELRKQLMDDLRNEVYSNKQPEKQQQDFKLDDLKKELLSEVMNQVKDQALSETFNNLNSLIDKLGNMQSTYNQVGVQAVIPKNSVQAASGVQTDSATELTKINASEKQQTVKIPSDVNPLLANLLANANR